MAVLLRFPLSRALAFALLLLAWLGATSFAAAENATPTTSEHARETIASLRAQIARHDELYHRQAAPEISDYAYDQLKQQLRDLERAFPELAAQDSSPPDLADDRTGLFRTARHRERMLSLDKTYAPEELKAFLGRLAKRLRRDDLAYVIEPKFDGLAVSVTYERGMLVRALTRGNGAEGEDITANVLMLRSLPRTLAVDREEHARAPIPDVIELRGEIYVPFDEFQRINAEREAAGEPSFANPRNLAAGTIRQTDPQVVARRGLEVVFYGVGACEPREVQPATQRALHEAIRAWGLPGVEEYWTANDAEGVWSTVQKIGQVRAHFEFPTDGAVVKLDDVALQRELGASTSAPHWAIAYKFAPDRVETQVKAITVQVGRTGVLTPVAELAPIELGGSRIARATLHNKDEIARKDIRVGDFVVLEKAGEIIPAIVSVNLARRPPDAVKFVFPEKCPACGTVAARQPLDAAVRCPNAACPAQLRRRLEHFASKDGVDIEGLGPAMIEQLVAKGAVKALPDLYRLRREDLLTPGKENGKTAERVLAAIDASRHAELWRVINGLGIPQVGTVAAKEVAKRYGSFATFAAASEFGGDAAGKALARYFAEPANRGLVEQLIAAGVHPPELRKEEAVAGKVSGKIFVLTGSLPKLTRAQATEKIEAGGGKVAGSVTKKTDYLVAGEDPGAKLARARELGTPVVDEAGLLRLLEKD